MKATILSVLMAICSFTFAEDNYSCVAKLKKTTLCVVIDNEEFDAYKKLKAAVEKSWTFTKYQFIKSSEIGEYINKPAYSVLTFIAITEDPASTQSKSYYSIGALWLTKEPIKRFAGWGLYILQGDVKNKYDSKKEIPANRLDHVSAGLGGLFAYELREFGSFDYMVAHVLKKLHSDVESINKKLPLIAFAAFGKMEKDGKTMYFNGGKSLLKGKTLLVDKDIIGKISTAKKYSETFDIPLENIKLVSKNEIASAVESGDETIVYSLNTDMPGTLIFSAKDSKIVAGIR